MTTPTTAELLKFADLQMAAEAFLVDPITNAARDLKPALVASNGHASKFTELQATNFADHWAVLDQKANTATGFSGTLFKCIQDDPTTGAKAGELVMSIRSTEFIDDAARDNMMSNTLELKNTGWAWGQIADMQAWYLSLKNDPGMLQGKSFSLTGCSLGAHVVTAFNLLNLDAASQTVTFNSAGVDKMKKGQGDVAGALAEFNALRTTRSRVLDYLGDATLRTRHRWRTIRSQQSKSRHSRPTQCTTTSSENINSRLAYE